MTKAVTGARRQAALGFIFVTATMDVLSLGVMIPVLPELMKRFNGGDTATTALWTVLFATTWGVMQFFCAPVLGLMSDRFGRRPVILTSIFGLGIDFLFMAFAPGMDTEVEVRFEAVGAETRVTVEHRGWDSVPIEHVARHHFPDGVFLRRHAEWWRVLLEGLANTTVQAPPS